jgi:hypothetical protein
MSKEHWECEFEYHPKTLPQYFQSALEASSTVHTDESIKQASTYLWVFSTRPGVENREQVS